MRDLAQRLRHLAPDHAELAACGAELLLARLSFIALGLLLAASLIACQAGDAMPAGRGVDPVVTGPAPTPIGAWGLCIRNPEELRCQPTAD